VPVAVAVLAMSPFGNGWNYFVWGSVAALTGPPAYLIFKKIYGGRDLPEVGFEYADDDGSGAAVAAALATSGDESVAAPSVTGR
jgi:hypothetical protein